MTRPDIQQARLFAQLIADLEPTIWNGFMASVTDLQANVNWPLLLSELDRGNLDGAVAALNINEAAFAEYSAAVSNAYSVAAASTIAQIKQKGLVDIGIRFRMTDPGAQEFIQRVVAESVVGFTREQITIARQIIGAGFARGDGPRTIARDIAGRVGISGMREGGILGLDGPRAERLDKVRIGMRTPEGVKTLVIEHNDGSLSLRYKVNKATANRIIKAYREGVEVPAADRAISERQYFNALLKDRADTIAETETGNAVMAARDESWRQAAVYRGLDSNRVIKTWRHIRGAGKFHRPDHLAMSGKSVTGLDTAFNFPDGAQLRYAHDRRGGAKHTIRCGCDTEYRFPFIPGERNG